MDYNLKQFLEDPYNNKNNKYFNFTDFFCSKEELKERMEYFIPKLQQIIDSEFIDPVSYKVEFKNITPIFGPNYDKAIITKINDENDWIELHNGVHKRYIVNNNDGKNCYENWEEFTEIISD